MPRHTPAAGPVELRSPAPPRRTAARAVVYVAAWGLLLAWPAMLVGGAFGEHRPYWWWLMPTYLGVLVYVAWVPARRWLWRRLRARVAQVDKRAAAVTAPGQDRREGGGEPVTRPDDKPPNQPDGADLP